MSSKSFDTRPRGRPRGFDKFEALDAAMRTFWAHGYDGASIDLLCREMAMPRASLYAGFGGKEGVFLAAIDHYAATRLGPALEALGGDRPIPGKLEDFFAAIIRLATADPRTPGCLISCVLADAAGTSPTFRSELAARYDTVESALEVALLSPASGRTVAQARHAAGMLAATARGLMLRARSGAPAKDLMPCAQVAIHAV